MGGAGDFCFARAYGFMRHKSLFKCLDETIVSSDQVQNNQRNRRLLHRPCEGAPVRMVCFVNVGSADRIPLLDLQSVHLEWGTKPLSAFTQAA